MGEGEVFKVKKRGKGRYGEGGGGGGSIEFVKWEKNLGSEAHTGTLYLTQATQHTHRNFQKLNKENLDKKIQK